MQPSEVYILKSELALRRHAVLMPAEVPAAKRQRTSGSVQSNACARAHAFTPDSPLSPSKVPRSASANALAHEQGITEDPAGSPTESSGDEANFAVRTDSELEGVSSEPAQASKHEEAPDLVELPAEQAATEGLQAASERQINSDTAPALHPPDEHAASQQQSTAGPGVSAPSNTSHETNVGAALSKDGADSPSSPQVLNDQVKASADEAPQVLPATQPPNPQLSTASPGLITIDQLLSSGPYQLDAEQQRVVDHNLKVYKVKVNEVHALGRVSPALEKCTILFDCHYAQGNPQVQL